MNKKDSRGSLWVALGILTLPLIIEATGGCSFQSPPSSGVVPIDDNAYTCACDCDEGPRNVNIRVAASSDDAEQAGGAMTLNGLDLDMGSTIVGIRFNAVSIPHGATIQSAFVQFTADETTSVTTNLQIVGQLSPDAATFSTTANDLSGRPATVSSVPWNNVGAWTAGNSGGNQRTPDLKSVIQELVNQPGWSAGSPIVLRIGGAGQRAARSFDVSPAQAPQLQVTFDSSVSLKLPVCATPDIVAFNVNGKLPQDLAQADCANRVATSLEGISATCTYPSQCTCNLVIPAMGDATFDSKVCDAPCTENPLDPGCSDFDPKAFNDCVATNGTNCQRFLAATNAPGKPPVCVASGSPLAFQMFGRRSTCEVEGTSHVEVGDREPTQDPDTTGTVDILGGPCPGGGCSVGTFFNLAMEPITFSVRFASDPTFSDLSASGHSRSNTALLGIDATFAEDSLEGTGNGRRGTNGLAVNALNQTPVVLGIDWAGRACDFTGDLASTVDGENPDGTCEGDGTTLCTADSPDCDDVGGPCVFEAVDTEAMTIEVALSGTLVNQPPTAAAGADQTLECTSTTGASFTLNGSASSDPDQDISLVSWRAGGRTGNEVGQSLNVARSQGVGVAQSYVLRVIDSFAQADEDTTQVQVVDTTPPQLSFTVSPAIIFPSPSHKLVTVTASITTSDTCDANPAIRLISITSNEPDNGLGDGDTPRDIQGAAFGTDDRQFQLRAERSGLGQGRIYTITYEAADDSGNVTVRQATVTVPRN
jgi:hypothetical protein